MPSFLFTNVNIGRSFISDLPNDGGRLIVFMCSATGRHACLHPVAAGEEEVDRGRRRRGG